MNKLTFIAILFIFILTGCARYPDGANPIISNYLSHTNAGNQKRSIMHTGIDIGGKVGTPILAAADGYVLNSWYSGGGGNSIIIDHGQDSDGSYIRTLYCHNDKNLVVTGDTVKRGSLSDRVGNSSSLSFFKYLLQPQHLVMKGGAGRWTSLPATK